MTTSGYSELDAEAIRVIKKTSGLWTPGRFKGKITKMDITLPITFKIDE
jgi:outer membrane biosynthesis protein TonB